MAKAKKTAAPGAPAGDIKHATQKVTDQIAETEISKILAHMAATEAGDPKSLGAEYGVVRPLLRYFSEQLPAGSTTQMHLINFLDSMDLEHPEVTE